MQIRSLELHELQFSQGSQGSDSQKTNSPMPSQTKPKVFDYQTELKG